MDLVMHIGSEEKTVKLTSYIRELPSRRRTLMCLLAMGFTFGVLTHLMSPVRGAWPYGFLIELVNRGSEGLLLISIPAILSAFTVTIIKQELVLRKSMFIALVCSLVYVLFYSMALFGGNLGITNDFLFIGFGIAFAVWYLVSRVFFNIHWYTAFLLSLIQLVYNASFLVLGKLIFVNSSPAAMVIKLYLSSFAFLAAIYAVFWLINAPMKRNFGVSGVDALTLFLAQWTNKSKGLEGMFQSVGETAETYVNVLQFKGLGGDHAKSCLFVTPSVHFGPFGNLGGSEFPHLIAERLKAEGFGEVFVFHGTATHDFNPVATEEIESLLDGCRKAVAGMRLEKAKGALLYGRQGTCRASCFMFNRNCFISLTRAPRTTEDIEFSIGTAIRYLALSKGMDDVAVVDAHNSETGEITRVHMGDPISFEYIDSIEAALGKKKTLQPVKLGIHSDQMREFSGIVGRGGLKTAVFRIGKRNFAILLFDANGIRPGFRRRIIDAVRERGVNCDVYTTDTHSVNAVRGVLNPLGEDVDVQRFLGKVLNSVEKARQNLSPVYAGMRTERIMINVFGAQQSSELLGTINSIIAVARVAVPIVFIITALFVLWAMTGL